MRFALADIVIDIGGTETTSQEPVPTNYTPFVTTRRPDVSLAVHTSTEPPVNVDEVPTVFDAGGSWRLHRDGSRWVIALQSPTVGPAPYLVACLEEDFSAGDIYRPPMASELPPLLGFPLPMLLTVGVLAFRDGMLIHACGLDCEGAGYLFAGNSGDGKSTIAKLWNGRAKLLNDDRIILRVVDGRPMMYGTPWHGEIPTVSAAGVPLRAGFFLSHAGENRADDCSGAGAAALLIARGFPPYWSAKATEHVIQTAAACVTNVDFRRLGFAPTAGVVDFVLGLD